MEQSLNPFPDWKEYGGIFESGYLSSSAQIDLKKGRASFCGVEHVLFTLEVPERKFAKILASWPSWYSIVEPWDLSLGSDAALEECGNTL